MGIRLKHIILFLALVLLVGTVQGALTDDLIHYWRFNDGANNATDYVGDWNFSYSNVAAVPGKEGLGVRISTGYLSQTVASLPIQNNTLCMWTHHKATGNVRHWDIGNNNDAGYYSWSLDNQAGSPTHYLDTTNLDIGYTVGNGNWYHICFRLSNQTGNNFLMAINGTLDRDKDATGTTKRTMNTFTLGARRYNGGFNRQYSNITFDEVAFWNRTLSDAEILEVYLLNGASILPTGANPAHSNIDLLFSNTTDRQTYDTIFNEGEDFIIYINWTDQGTALNTSNGSCNITLNDAITENTSLIQNYTICTVGCNYTTLTEELKQSDTINAKNDTFRVQVCHDNLLQDGFIFNVSCLNGHEDFTVDAGDFLSCSQEYQTLIFETDICSNRTAVNYTIEAPVIYNRRKRFIKVDFDRIFFNHTDVLLYNSSSLLWYSPEHEYYTHGAYSIYGNCTHSTDSEFNNATTEIITIENRPPTIIYGKIVTNDSSTDFVNNANVSFAYGDWVIDWGVIDDDVDTVILNFSNSTGQVYYKKITGNVSGTITLSSTVFDDFTANPFSLYIWVNDTNKSQANETRYFNVTDFVNPLCTGFDDTTRLIDTLYNWSLYCVDENFFSLNISCTNGYSYSVTGLNVPSYSFNQGTIINQTTVCNYTYCDGHTGELSEEWFIRPISKDRLIEFETLSSYNRLELIDEIAVNISYVKEFDRITFSLDFPETPPRTIEFYYTTSPKAFYFPSFKYKAWIVDAAGPGTWFDLNSEFDQGKITVNRWNLTTWKITISDFNTQTLEFRSIGELNCISGSQTINATGPPDLEGYIEVRVPPTVAEIMLVFFLFALWIAFIIMTFTLKGPNGHTIQVLNLAQMGLAIVAGSYAFMYINRFVGLLAIAVGLMILVAKLFE